MEGGRDLVVKCWRIKKGWASAVAQSVLLSIFSTVLTSLGCTRAVASLAFVSEQPKRAKHTVSWMNNTHFRAPHVVLSVSFVYFCSPSLALLLCSVRRSFALLGPSAGQEKPFARKDWLFSQKFIYKNLQKVSVPFWCLILEVQSCKVPTPPHPFPPTLRE